MCALRIRYAYFKTKVFIHLPANFFWQETLDSRIELALELIHLEHTFQFLSFAARRFIDMYTRTLL